MSKVYGFIPARGGSKSIIKKNIIPLMEKPLIAYTIEAAQNAGIIDCIVVSSDDPEILNISVKWGIVAIERPLEFGEDDTPVSAALDHFISYAKLADEDVIVILQPTSPLRTGSHIKDAVALYKEHRQAIVSIDTSKLFPEKYIHIVDGKILAVNREAATESRQNLKEYYKPNGAIYIFNVGQFRAVGNVPINGAIPYEMGKVHSLDIDDYQDLELANYILEATNVQNRD